MAQCKEEEISLKKPHKKISYKELKALGYKLTDEQIPLGNKPYKFAVIEVKNEDNNKEVGFCFLYIVADKMGIILPNPFRYYQLRPRACYEHLR